MIKTTSQKSILLDVILVSVSGLIVASIVGILQNPNPFGDDSIQFVGMIGFLASGLPHVFWDPHSFAGYSPTTGLSWVNYLPPVILVKIGFDPVSAFHFSFVIVLILYGLSVYFLSRVLGATRLVSIFLPILAWSTNSYWSGTIWGGAYNRVFTLPLSLVALACTFKLSKFLNAGTSANKEYVICLLTWTLTLLGDVFISIASVAIGSLFLLLSAGGGNNLVVGSKRVMLVFSPVLLLTSWQWIPIVQQAMNTIPHHYAVPNNWAWLILPGSTWQSTLNLVYLPSIAGFAILRLLVRAKFETEEKALVLSLGTMAAYWLLAGWVPVTYGYVPRIMATYSSVENLATIFLIVIATLSSGLRLHFNLWKKISLRFITVTLPRPNFAAILTALFLIFVLVNAGIILPSIKPVDWGPLESQLNAALADQTGPSSNSYRVSLSNRILTRSLPFYQPDRMGTGGRLFPLDLNSFFHNWYTADVFFKSDLGSLNSVYLEDRPVGDFAPLMESSSNFAGPSFWLNWYGANDIVFFPYYNLYNTIDNYTARSSLYSVTQIPTGFYSPEIFIRPLDTTPILMATNATVVGFYSGGSSSVGEYRSMIALLSYLGMGPQYVVPLYLSSMQEATSTPLEILVTDSDTYTEHTSEIASMLGRGANVIVVSSDDNDSNVQPIVQVQGKAVLARIGISFNQLVNLHEAGAYEFVQSIPIVRSQSVSTKLSGSVSGQTLDLGPMDWAFNYKTPNLEGSIDATSNAVTLNLTNMDNSSRGQFNIEAHLQTPTPLTSGVELQILVKASADVVIGESFASRVGCCPNYIGTPGQTVSTGGWELLHVPFSYFTEWGDLNSTFGLARNLILAVNTPPGLSNVTVQFSNVTLTYPSYGNFTLQTPVQLSNNSVLGASANGSAGIILSNQQGYSSGALSIQSGYPVTSTASFTGGTAGELFDNILVVGTLVSSPVITVFNAPPWEVVPSEWTSNQVLNIPAVPRGFLGLVWKETYTTQWNVETVVNKTARLLNYQFAGPGMLYIPTNLPVGTITISFETLTTEAIAAYSVALITLVTLAALGGKTMTFGYSKRRWSEPRKAKSVVSESLDIVSLQSPNALDLALLRQG